MSPCLSAIQLRSRLLESQDQVMQPNRLRMLAGFCQFAPRTWYSDTEPSHQVDAVMAKLVEAIFWGRRVAKVWCTMRFPFGPNSHILFRFGF